MRARREGKISEPETSTFTPAPEAETEEVAFGEEPKVAIVGAGGYGRIALDALIAAGAEELILGFYDDAHLTMSEHIRGFPVLGDVAMLKSILSVEPVFVIVAITANRTRLRIANSIRGLGGCFVNAIHPRAYLSAEATIGDGTVVGPGAVVHPDAVIGSHCYIGPNSVVDRDSVIGAGSWISPGAVVGPGAQVGARAILGQNSSVGRKAVVMDDERVEALRSVTRENQR